MKNTTEEEHLLLQSLCKECVIESCSVFIHIFSKFIIELYLKNTVNSDMLYRICYFVSFMLLLKSAYSRGKEQQAFDVRSSSRTGALTKSTMASLQKRLQHIQSRCGASGFMADHRGLIRGKNNAFKNGSCIILALQIKGMVAICESSNEDMNTEVPASILPPDKQLFLLVQKVHTCRIFWIQIP